MSREAKQRRLTSLEQEFQLWRPQFLELQKYVRPTLGFFDDQPNSGKAPDYQALINGTPSRSVRILAAGMTSGLSSPARPWFRLGTPDEDLNQFQAVREWLDLVQSRMLTIFAKSNIYFFLHKLYEELGTFATGCGILLDDFDAILRGRNFTCGEYFLGTGKNGRVTDFGRYSFFSVGQLVDEFGLENVSASVRSLYDQDQLDRWVKVAHLIEPNRRAVPGKEGKRNFPYASHYWEWGSPETDFLRQDGFRTFPVLAPRWDLTTSNDYYGKGPSWEALGDIRMLQKLEMDYLLAVEKLGNPPMQADASVEKINTLPGGITRSSSTNRDAGVRPAYEINPNLEHMQLKIRAVEMAVEAWFYTDLFLMLAQNDNGQMTAREVAERHEEKLLMLGPVVERLIGELHNPLIDRTFDLMLLRRIVPPPPQELQGMELKVEYISVLAQAQKMVGVAGLSQSAAFLGTLQPLKPDIIDVYDLDEMAIQYGTQTGLPPKIIRAPDEIAAIRKQRADAQAQQQLAEQSMAAVQGAKVLADTKLNQGSALDALMGNQGSGGNQT